VPHLPFIYEAPLFFKLIGLAFIICSVRESKASHPGRYTKDVVVDGEELLGLAGTGLEGDGHLGVVDAGEVAGAGGLVLLGLEGEGVGVDARVRGAGVVEVRLDLVEVLAGLLLEAVLAVEDELEAGQRTDLGTIRADNCNTLLDLGDGGASGGLGDEEARDTGGLGEHDGVWRGAESRIDGDLDVGGVGGEVPEGVASRGPHGVGRVLVAPHELLDRVVQGETHELSTGTSAEAVATGVLHLLDEVLVGLLGETAALLGVEEHVVGPHDWLGGCVKVIGEVGCTVEIQTDLVVLEGDEREVEARVAVEEEEEREVHLG